MCSPSTPSAGHRQCYVCAFSRAPKQHNPTLSGMPTDVVMELIAYDPKLVFLFQQVSHGFREHACSRLKWNADEIVHLASQEKSSLYSLILRNHARICGGLFNAQSSPSSIAGLSHVTKEFHQSLHGSIELMGLPRTQCRWTLLSPQDVAQFNRKIEDHSLKIVWSRIHAQIIKEGLMQQGFPRLEAAAQPGTISNWMHQKDAQTILQKITCLDLSWLRLECLPQEIALLTGLQTLDLSSNNLTFIPDHLFEKMQALQELVLWNNSLGISPMSPGLFRHLSALRKLNLENNQLGTHPLPEGLLDGLASLEFLTLCGNSLGVHDPPSTRLPERTDNFENPLP